MLFKEFIKKENPIIFEIGTNDGEDTLNFFNEFKSPTLHCFEPDPATFERFLKKTEKFKESIHGSCSAVSDKTGTSNFIISSNLGLSSSLKKPVLHIPIHKHVQFVGTKVVNTITLDEYAKQNNISYCDLVWMDVQGAEDLVIKGGENFFKNTKYVYTEFSNVELYEGALGKYEIEKLLPNFKIVEVVREWYADGDVLLVNKD